MSHHAHGYLIYPDNSPEVPQDSWCKADRWINGFEVRKDYREAVALAKLGALNCRVPFIVHERPLGGIRPEMCPYWVITY